MSQTSQSQALNNGDAVKLTHLYEEYQGLLGELLEFEQFTIDDVPAGRDKWCRLIRKLRARGIISAVDTKYRDNKQGGSDTVRVWEWKSAAVKHLRQYHEDRDCLPCGHRAHIYHRDDGGFGCRYCEQDREFERATVEAVMSA